VRDFVPFEWIVALRFLREGRMQSLFIIAGVAIGVAVIVFMSALLAGLQGNFIRRVLTAQAHIELLPPREVAVPQRGRDGEHEIATVQQPLQRLRSIDQWQAIVRQIAAQPGVRIVTPIASGSVLAVRGDASRAVSVLGVDPAQYFGIVTIPDKIVAGTATMGPQDVLVGTELATDLGLTVGDKLRLSAAGGRDQILNVAGLFDLGNKGANQRTTMVPLRTAQALLGLAGGISAIEIAVHDVYAAERIAHRVTQLTGVQADSWIKTNAQFFTAVQAQQTSNTAIRFFVGLSVALGIASVLVVSVVQRSREIGILRATGTSRGQILRVFLLQGGLLGLGGSLAGSMIGASALALWQRFARNPDGTPLFPLELPGSLFVLAAVLATLTGVAAAVAPALRAARLDPVQAIRG
jgi:lipoprotein-releasing system permease protein